MAELVARRMWDAEAQDPDCGYMIVTGLQRASAEVAAAMNLPPGAASALVCGAHDLDSGFPKVLAVLCAGGTDWRTVQIILKRTKSVGAMSIRAALDARLAAVIGRWQSWSRKRVVNAVDAMVRDLDPDAVAERERAEDNRHFDITPVGNGTAKVDGVLDAESAVIVDGKISDLANGVCPSDPRSMKQRRADALPAMAQGTTLACRCPTCAGTPAPFDSGGVRAVLNLVADRSTMLGEADHPGYLAGFGVIDADQVRRLAVRARLRTLTPPVVTAEDRLRYQPSGAVERIVRLRDLTCRFPGCDRPAERCDLDHTVPFNHLDPAKGGPATPENLKCLCRQHHRLKTFIRGWRDEQLPDGTIVWTSPSGHTYRTVPGGVELFPRIGPLACSEPKPQRRNPTRERARRLARTREKHRTLRPINAARRRLESAHAYEIENRRHRNRRRRTALLMLKHRRTTSPYIRWINDPYEPETLPPDWQPPPEPETADEPPF
ncbi:DUF222 domain-containing protein [Mycolicibacterium litorale]|uniref:HNH endonuclease signature motif containing protein n=1 Tax=Mycolicibacterium litorale TaxID=758802 RepID=UPI003CEA1DE3